MAWLFTLQPMKTKRPQHLVALSAQLVELDGVVPTEVRLTPAGTFRSSRDSRLADVPAWVMNTDAALAICSAANGLKSRFLIDYDHQTLRSAENGKPAPAAGWGASLEWREGDGLYAVNIDWTAEAMSAIESKAYRYISPVLKYNDKTGVVTAVLMAALTNYPAIDDLTDLAATAALIFDEGTTVDEDLLERLRWFLNMPITATPADMSAELDKLKPMLAKADGTTVGLSAFLTEKTDAVAALSAQVGTVDPALYVPVAAFNEVHKKLTALSGDTTEMKVAQLIEGGLKDGRIIGDAMKNWLTDLGSKDIAALSGWLDSAQPIAALSGMQSQGRVAPESLSALTGDELAQHQFKQSTALQAEFGDVATYLAYTRAEQSGTVKILGDK